MVSTESDTLALWINGFFALAAVGVVLAVVALTVLFLSTRRSGQTTVATLPHRASAADGWAREVLAVRG